MESFVRYYRGSPSEIFLGKGVLKICRKFTGEHPYRSAISIKLQSNYLLGNNKLKCGIIYGNITMRAGNDERIINYGWPNVVHHYVSNYNASRILRHNIYPLQ